MQSSPLIPDTRKKATPHPVFFIGWWVVGWLTLGLLPSAWAQTQAPPKETKPEYCFIRFDSLAMHFPDSVEVRGGRKITTDRLTTDESLYYYTALTPRLPIWVRHTPFRSIPESERATFECFRFGGGLVGYCINYVAVVDGDTVLINSEEKFRELFAPVESAQEALAFAYLFTDSKPMYNLDFLTPGPRYDTLYLMEYDSLTHEIRYIEQLLPILRSPEEGWELYDPIIISSYVRPTSDGYECLLYHWVVFSCSHPYLRRTVKVTFDGRVEILEETPAFERRRDMGLCLD